MKEAKIRRSSTTSLSHKNLALQYFSAPKAKQHQQQKSKSSAACRYLLLVQKCQVMADALHIFTTQPPPPPPGLSKVHVL